MILKITQVITLSINQYSQTGNIDQWDNLSHIRQSGYLLVGEQSCTDKKNIHYIFSDAFYELAMFLMDEYGLPEAGSPIEALLLFQEIYKLVIDA